MPLLDIVGRLDRPSKADDDTLAPHRRGRCHPDSVTQVGRSIEAELIGGPHRAGHHDRLGSIEDQVPAEARLLDRVRTLDHDGASDAWVRERRPQDRGDVEKVGKAEVAGRHPTAIDRDHLGDRVET